MFFSFFRRNFFPHFISGIFLSGFKLTAKEIERKLSLFREEDGAFPMDHVIALKRYRMFPHWVDVSDVTKSKAFSDVTTRWISRTRKYLWSNAFTNFPRFLPTTEEQEMYRNYKEDINTLLPEDQFMLKVKWTGGRAGGRDRQWSVHRLYSITKEWLLLQIVCLLSVLVSLQLCDIPYLEKRLDLLLVLMEFPIQFEDLQPVSSLCDGRRR